MNGRSSYSFTKGDVLSKKLFNNMRISTSDLVIYPIGD
jgi:hypothetical protein